MGPWKFLQFLLELEHLQKSMGRPMKIFLLLFPFDRVLRAIEEHFFVQIQLFVSQYIFDRVQRDYMHLSAKAYVDLVCEWSFLYPKNYKKITKKTEKFFRN